MHPLLYTTGMVRFVRAKLISFDSQPQIHKNYSGAHIKGMHRVMLKYSNVLRAELVSIAEQQTPSKGWIYRDLSTYWFVSRHLVISNWHGCYSAWSHVPGCVVFRLLRYLWWCSSAGCKSLVSALASQCGAASTMLLQWHSSVGLFQHFFFQWCSSVPCKYSLVHPVVSQCTLGQPVAFQ